MSAFSEGAKLFTIAQAAPASVQIDIQRMMSHPITRSRTTSNAFALLATDRSDVSLSV
jgi:hypothetical protein